MSADEMKRLKKLVPVISKRMAGKTKGLVRKMKKLRIIKEDEFSDDVNPPDKVLEKLADSGNTNICEDLKTEMIKEGLQDIVLDIIEGKTSKTKNPTEPISVKASSSANVVSDESYHRLDYKLQIQETTKDKHRLQMESSNEEIQTAMDMMEQKITEKMSMSMGAMERKMTEGFKDMGEILREIQEESGRKEQIYLEMIKKLEKEIKELKLRLEDKETSYNMVKKQFDVLEKNHNDLHEEMEKKKIKEKNLIEMKTRLQKEIEALKKKLIDKQTAKTARGKLYNDLSSPRK